MKNAISFEGTIQLCFSSYDNPTAAIQKEWTIALFTEDGKRIAPMNVTLTAPSVYTDGLNFVYRDFTAKFALIDADTRKPILTPETKFIEIAVAGEAGRMKAHYDIKGTKRK